ncbi:MAG TPA: alpha/beta hydrolase [Chitinophagaceae bacterium]|nr:alpha/beta hydrolase [Chitinophagaceae bacterium]
MGYIKLRGINYFFEDLNSEKKDVVLLVHGHPFDHSMWRYQIDSLKNFRLILTDLRGYGKTDYDFDKIYIEEHALDLIFLLDSLNIEKVHLVGLSMGGQIIIEFARLFPHRSKSLIICDSNPAGENENSYKERLGLIDRMNEIGMHEYTQQDIHKYLHPASVQQKGEAYQHLFSMMVNTNVKGAMASHRGRAERRDNFSYLNKIKIPALVIVGDKNFFTPIGELKKIASEIANAGFIVIENSGHMPNMEQPEQFNKAMLDFLKK